MACSLVGLIRERKGERNGENDSEVTATMDYNIQRLSNTSAVPTLRIADSGVDTRIGRMVRPKERIL